MSHAASFPQVFRVSHGGLGNRTINESNAYHVICTALLAGLIISACAFPSGHPLLVSSAL